MKNTFYSVIAVIATLVAGSFIYKEYIAPCTCSSTTEDKHCNCKECKCTDCKCVFKCENGVCKPCKSPVKKETSVKDSRLDNGVVKPLLFKGAFQAGGPELNGETVTCDMPTTEHLQNKAGSDGLGLCVFTSLDLAARWCNEPALIGFRDFMTKYPGGGYPSKVDEYIPKMAQSKGLPSPNYIQHEGGDPEFLKLALKTGRYVSVTYAGNDGVFYNIGIDHMVNLVHLTDKIAVILDNNNPGKYLWMPSSEFISRWKARGGGWAVVLLKPGPPPIPVNWKRIDNIKENIPSLTWGNELDSFVVVKDKGKPWVGISEDGVLVHAAPFQDQIKIPVSEKEDYGVNRKLIKEAISYKLNGNEVTKEQAYKVMEGKLVDDSKLYRLTINLADANLRNRIECDIKTNPALANWKDKLLVQSYDPSNWAVSGVGHKPGIILQSAPDPKGFGIVIFRMTEYTGPETLAEALRVADQNYNSDKDPNPSKPLDLDNLKNIDLKNLPMWVYLIAGALGFLFLRKQQTNTNQK